MPGKRADSAERDEQIGQLMSAMARMEKRQAGLTNEMATLDAKVTGMFSGVADDAKLIRGVRGILSKHGWALGGVILAFVVGVYILREQLGFAREQLVELKGKQEYTDAKLNTVDNSVRSMSSALEQWKIAEERRLDQAEKRIERLDERRKR
jgi:hypothetical protein